MSAPRQNNRLMAGVYLRDALDYPLNRYVYLEHGKGTPVTVNGRTEDSKSELGDVVEGMLKDYPEIIETAKKLQLPEDQLLEHNLWTTPPSTFDQLRIPVMEAIDRNLRIAGVPEQFFSSPRYLGLYTLICNIIQTEIEFKKQERDFKRREEYGDTR